MRLWADTFVELGRPVEAARFARRSISAAAGQNRVPIWRCIAAVRDPQSRISPYRTIASARDFLDRAPESLTRAGLN